jgi:hypothetical protein
MDVEATSPDLSTVVFYVLTFDVATFPGQGRMYVYDEHAGTTRQLPPTTGVAVSPDGRSVAFTSTDGSLQVGPTAAHCVTPNGPVGPYQPALCAEVYLFDVDTGSIRQLTGLGGSSDVEHSFPRFTEDGTGIEVTAYSEENHTTEYRHIHLATGQIDPGTPPTFPTSWDLGSHTVRWDEATGTLTSEDATTGEVTTLWADPDVYSLERVTGGGRFVVISRWVSNQNQAVRVIDTETRAIKTLKTTWISDDGSRQALVQSNVAPDGIDRLILAPVPW